jgi:hypothetical protein
MKRRYDMLPALAILIASAAPASAQASSCQEDGYGSVRCDDGSYGQDNGGVVDVYRPYQQDDSGPPARCIRGLDGRFVCQ